jgi:hypothetical protein
MEPQVSSKCYLLKQYMNVMLRQAQHEVFEGASLSCPY